MPSNRMQKPSTYDGIACPGLHADARSEEGRKQDPELYEKLKKQLHERLNEELEKNETPGIDKLDLDEDPAPGETR